MSYRSFISAAQLRTACQHSADQTTTTIVQQFDSAVVSNTADTLTNEEYADTRLVIADTLQDVLQKTLQLAGQWVEAHVLKSVVYPGCMH